MSGVATNFDNLVLAFKKYGVEFMLTGGYAVNFHGLLYFASRFNSK